MSDDLPNNPPPTDQSPPPTQSLANDTVSTDTQSDTTPKDTQSSLANDQKTEDKKPEDKPQVPEKYEFKAPDGYTLNEKAVEEFSGIAKELGLSQEGAQKLVDMYIKQQTEIANEPFKAYEEMRGGWRKEVIDDKDLGNGKDNLSDETRAALGRLKDTLPAEVRAKFEEAMNLTGAGDHPAFVRAMKAWSKHVTEGRPTSGNPPKPQEGKPSPAQALYPNLPSANQPQRG